MFTNATNKLWSLLMNGLADVDGFKLCIQVCVWLGFPALILCVYCEVEMWPMLQSVVKLRQNTCIFHSNWYMWQHQHPDIKLQVICKNQQKSNLCRFQNIYNPHFPFEIYACFTIWAVSMTWYHTTHKGNPNSTHWRLAREISTDQCKFGKRQFSPNDFHEIQWFSVNHERSKYSIITTGTTFLDTVTHPAGTSKDSDKCDSIKRFWNSQNTKIVWWSMGIFTFSIMQPIWEKIWGNIYMEKFVEVWRSDLCWDI